MTTAISFSSPKGGSGRTLVAAHAASILAQGCAWAGLKPATVLAIDLDLRAPGVHYYMGALAETGVRLRWRGELIGHGAGSRDALRRCIIDHRIGMLWWLTEYVQAQSRLRSTAQTAPSEEFDACWSPTADDRRSPFYHLIELEFESSTILFIPAGDPETAEFLDTSLAFSLMDFFEPRIHDGGEVLTALYRHIIERWGEVRADRPIDYLLLDQDAGQTVTSAINFGTARTNVIISKLDDQSRAGLRSLVEQTGVPEDTGWDGGDARANLRVVLSQYDGRYHALANRWWVPASDNSGSGLEKPLKSEFQLDDDSRHETVVELQRLGVDPDRQIFLVDFDRRAVQKEYFFPKGSPSHNDMVRLAVSLVEPIEGTVPSEERATSSKAGLSSTGRVVPGVTRLRILGEQILGSAGTFDAFVKWAEGAGIEVDPVGSTHDLIVERIQKGASGKATSEEALANFDIVALPAYARLLWDEGFERFEGVGSGAPSTQDCAGPIDEAYLERAILGWSEYARYQGRLLGYPLFVDCPLIVVNSMTVDDDFFRDFRAQEDRFFRGFEDPADFRDVVRSAATNTERGDQLIMTLNQGSIAPWYEWLAVVAMFCGDPGDLGLGGGYESPTSDGVRRFLGSPVVRRATLRYLELVSYADPKSHEAGWSYAIQQMNANDPQSSVGMTLAWPDAPPDSKLPEKFHYAVPPGVSVSDCWLMCVPRGRREGPEVREIEHLLQRFLTYDEQRRLVREFRGLPVHRRVLAEVDLWRTFPHLASLDAIVAEGDEETAQAGGHRKGRLRPRPVGPGAVRFARAMRDGLVMLCETTNAKIIATYQNPSDRAALWHTDSFLKEIRITIKSTFDAIAGSV